MLSVNLTTEISAAQAELSDLMTKLDSLQDIRRADIQKGLENVSRRLEAVKKETVRGAEGGPEGQQPDDGLTHCDARFRAIFPQLAGVFYEWDPQTGSITRSEGLMEMLGVPSADLAYADQWIERTRKDDRLIISQMSEEVKRGRRDTYDLQYHMRHADGRWVLVWDRGFIERDARGNLLRALGILEDVTRLKQFEQTLMTANTAMAKANIRMRQKEEQINMVLGSTPFTFFQTDVDLRYTWIYNPMLDMMPEQYLGKRDEEIFPIENAAVLTAIKQTALEYRLPVRREVTLTSKGEQKVMYVAAQTLLVKMDRSTGW